MSGVRHRNRTAAALTSGAGLVTLAVVWASAGRASALSVLVGLALVLVFCWSGAAPFVVAGDGRQGRAGLGFLVLGLNYALRLVLALVVLEAVSRSGAMSTRAVGLAVIGFALVWTGTHVVLGLSRRHAPFLEPVPPTGPDNPVRHDGEGTR
ncbi:MAG: hypothetical protein JWN35_973 [Frankiales bacterium]|nr:hypothetical protein [Frankiales bacterium]